MGTWLPENADFWHREGHQVARRNLVVSVLCLFLAFAVWMIWSVLVVYLPEVGFHFTMQQLFWLVAAPSLSGATLRIVYSFMVPIVGGRRWTAFSTALLLVPALGTGWAVTNPHTPYGLFLALAVLCGLGGANFSSSMANVSLFYPRAEKGSALGLNAGIGNLGVSAVQFIVPIVISFALFGVLGGAPEAMDTARGVQPVWLQNAGFIWVAPLLACTVLAWFCMNDIASIRASFTQQLVVFKRLHTWVLCLLYLGVFGSFIGFSAVFPLLTHTQFPTVNAVKYAFLGPLLGSLWRVAGGWLADRLKGSRVLIGSFAAMAVAIGGVLHFMPHAGHGGSFAGFFAMFMLLFTASGIGNGACSQMMPVVFLRACLNKAPNGEEGRKAALIEGTREGATVLGFTGAIGAYGGFLLPQGFSFSLAHAHSAAPAFAGLIALYGACMVITWFFYQRSATTTPC
ncbi:MFS transporter [Formicincola oecophyllae]|uniref:MFS transporter n=1 Tax=Formicincola oecophyllae TaxID=2558361 RepID=UPI001F0ECD89|nr:MFS transporter [Formicincola oecophyllae]